VTNDSRLHSRLRELKDQGRREKGTGGDDLHYALGYNLKLTNLQAAVGLAQMEQLPNRVEHARCIYRQYREGLRDTPGIRLLKFDLGQQETPLWIDAVVEDRQSLTQQLSEAGCETRNFWYPLHKQKSYRRPDEQFPQSTRLVPQSLWLPSSFQLTEDDIVHICDTIKSALADKRELVHEHDAIRQRGQ